MANELVVTPGGYRPSEMVYKIGADLKLRILTGRLQGVNDSGAAVADYGSVPRDGSNPALTPGYALPPGVETPEGSEPGASLGRGWISFAHWRNDGSEAISSFRSSWRVPPEPETRSGQTIFLFLAMQDPIPMTLLPALQWGSSAAGGGEYWSVATWYVGGTTGAVFHGELTPVNVGDELTGVIALTGRRREHYDYRAGFDGLGDADLPVHGVRQLSRTGLILAAYGVTQCSDYPASSATGFRGIEVMTGFRHPALAWNAADTVTDCGQHVVVLSDANPDGEVDVHYRQLVAEPEPEPVEEAPIAAELEAEVEAAMAAEAAAEPEPEPVLAEALGVVAAEAAREAEAEAVEAEPLVAAIEEELEPAPELEAELPPELVMAEALEEETEPAAEAPEAMEPSFEEEEEAAFIAAMEMEAEPEVEAEAVTILVVEAEPEPEPVAAAPVELAPEPAAGEAVPRPPAPEAPAQPVRLELSPGVGRLVEITIHNHAPAGSGSGNIEARLAALEATLTTLAQFMRPEAQQSGAGDLMSRLERLARLKGSGVLSDDEFVAVKTQLISAAVEPNGLDASQKAVLR